MKIAICATEDNIGSNVDNRFGRCEYFLIFEDGKLIESVKNDLKNSFGSAAVNATEIISKKGVEVVAAKEFGAKAEALLKKLNIDAINLSGTVRQAIYKLEKKRIFVPLLDNSGMDSRISEHFGHAPYFAIIISGKEPEIIENNISHHDDSKNPVEQIIGLANPDCIVARSIGERAIKLFSEHNIEIKKADCDTLKDVVSNFESLEKLSQGCKH